MPGEHVLRRDVPDGAVQTNVVAVRVATEQKVGFSRLRRARTESLGHNINSSDLGRPAPTFLKQQAGCSGARQSAERDGSAEAAAKLAQLCSAMRLILGPRHVFHIFGRGIGLRRRRRPCIWFAPMRPCARTEGAPEDRARCGATGDRSTVAAPKNWLLSLGGPRVRMAWRRWAGYDWDCHDQQVDLQAAILCGSYSVVLT
jgi:hypothetical protein